jgi:hypothetical protein
MLASEFAPGDTSVGFGPRTVTKKLLERIRRGPTGRPRGGPSARPGASAAAGAGPAGRVNRRLGGAGQSAARRPGRGPRRRSQGPAGRVDRRGRPGGRGVIAGGVPAAGAGPRRGTQGRARGPTGPGTYRKRRRYQKRESDGLSRMRFPRPTRSRYYGLWGSGLHNLGYGTKHFGLRRHGLWVTGMTGLGSGFFAGISLKSLVLSALSQAAFPLDLLALF